MILSHDSPSHLLLSHFYKFERLSFGYKGLHSTFPRFSPDGEGKSLYCLPFLIEDIWLEGMFRKFVENSARKLTITNKGDLRETWEKGVHNACISYQFPQAGKSPNVCCSACPSHLSSRIPSIPCQKFPHDRSPPFWYCTLRLQYRYPCFKKPRLNTFAAEGPYRRCTSSPAATFSQRSRSTHIFCCFLTMAR